MITHINAIKTLSEHLEAVEDPIAGKDLVIILISSLPDEYNFLINGIRNDCRRGTDMELRSR